MAECQHHILLHTLPVKRPCQSTFLTYRIGDHTLPQYAFITPMSTFRQKHMAKCFPIVVHKRNLLHMISRKVILESSNYCLYMLSFTLIAFPPINSFKFLFPIAVSWFHLISLKFKKISLAYGSQGNHSGQLYFCKWLVDNSTTR